MSAAAVRDPLAAIRWALVATAFRGAALLGCVLDLTDGVRSVTLRP